MRKPRAVLVFLDRPNTIDRMVFTLADRLFSRLENIVLAVEKTSDSRVRIVVKSLSTDVIDRVFEVVREVEEEFDEPGAIVPEIVDEAEYKALSHEELHEVPEDVLYRLRERLREKLSDVVVAVERQRTQRANVKVVVRGLSADVIGRVFEVVREVEEELDEPGAIVPEIVDEAEA